MKYQNKRNGMVAELVEINEKSKQVILQGDKPVSCTISTFKRWWKPLEDAYDADAEECVAEEVATIKKVEAKHVEDVLEEDRAGDGTPLADVGKEIAKQAKEKSKQVKKSGTKKVKGVRRTEPSEVIKEAMEYTFGLVTAQGDEVFIPSKNIKMRAFKVGGHMYCKFNYSNSSITVAVKSSVLDFDKVAAPHKTLNHMFDAVYVFKDKLTTEDKKLIKTLLSSAREYRVSKNNSAKEKK